MFTDIIDKDFEIIDSVKKYNNNTSNIRVYLCKLRLNYNSVYNNYIIAIDDLSLEDKYLIKGRIFYNKYNKGSYTQANSYSIMESKAIKLYLSKNKEKIEREMEIHKNEYLKNI